MSTMIRSSQLRVATPQLRVATPDAGTLLLGRLLEEQQTLTAVDRFSRAHDEHNGQQLPAQAKYYQDLIPLTQPQPGQQYAFEVDLDACTGCKACVAACHSLNGLDETEMWRSVGLLHGGTSQAPAQQTVTTSCHHCADPACLSGCPVQAYEKDPVTGIVRHLDDQCIGCQYCTLMCPYDAPKYSHRHGIVRKCDMCSDRLAGGEAPACVQGCPNQAIRIRLVDTIDVRARGDAGNFLPGAPTPEHTAPATVYRSERSAPENFLPADFYSVSPEHSHWPLVLLLVLTQLATGTFAGSLLGQRLLDLPAQGPMALALAAVALGMGVLALAASVFHLGRPLGAWRAFLGLRTSWMSREALTFAFFAKLGGAYALSLAAAGGLLPAFPGRDLLGSLATPLGFGTAGLGLAGVFSSAMIYAATRRRHWRLPVTAAKFFGSTVVLGAATLLLVVEVVGQRLPGFLGAHATLSLIRPTLLVLLVTGAGKLLFEAAALRHLRSPEHSAGKRAAILMVGDLVRATQLRFAAGLLALVVLPLVHLGSAGPAPRLAAAIFVLSLIGELAERYLFFTTAPPSRMPGALS
jgi:formate dehydrogenase iron-sulfur subunit